MGSHLSIGKLPYKVPYTLNEDIAHSNISAQFTTDTEVILSIQELEILLKAQWIQKALKLRACAIRISEAEYFLQNPDEISTEDYDYYSLSEILNDIRIKHMSRYYDQTAMDALNITMSADEILEDIKFIYNSLEIQLQRSKEYGPQLVEWAKKYFIEGEHFLYTL